jgi:hypothetical protein
MWRICILLICVEVLVGCAQATAPSAFPQGRLSGCGADMRLDIVSTPATRRLWTDGAIITAGTLWHAVRLSYCYHA